MRWLIGTFFMTVANIFCFGQTDEVVCLNQICFKQEENTTIVRKEAADTIPDTNPTLAQNFTYVTSDNKIPDTLINESRFYENIDQWQNHRNKRYFSAPSKDINNENDPYIESARPVIPIYYFNRPDCSTPIIFPEEEE